MDVIIFAFVLILCTTTGMREYNSEEQSKVFTKYPIRVNDVKKYNHFCGKLIIGFGLIAAVTMVLMTLFEGWISFIFGVLIIVEAIVLMKIYREGEKKFIQKK